MTTPARAWRGAAVDADVSVMTFNVLAEAYCDEGGFGYCPPHARRWAHRLALIIAEVRAAAPTVLALQEVEPAAFERDFVPAFGDYVGHYHAKPGSVVGVAVFTRRAAVDVLSVHRFSVRDLAVDAEVGGPLRGSPPPLPPIPRAGAAPATPPAARPSTSTTPVDDDEAWAPVVRAPSSPSPVGARRRPREGSYIAGTTWTRQNVAAHNRLWSWLDEMPHVALAVVVQPRRRAAAGADDDGVDAVAAQLARAAVADDAALPLPTPAATDDGDGDAHPLIVMCTHLYWNPQYPEVKVMQAALFVRAADRLRRAVDGGGGGGGRRRPAAVVFTGDLNIMPAVTAPSEHEVLAPGAPPFRTGVYELLTTGALPAGHPHHPATRRGLHPASVPPLELPLRWASAYADVLGAEPAWTNWHSHAFKEPLDYVFVATHERAGAADACGAGASALPPPTATPTATAVAAAAAPAHSSFRPLPSVMRAVAVLDVPADEDVLVFDGAAGGGCPNAGLPSDHVSMHVQFALDRRHQRDKAAD